MPSTGAYLQRSRHGTNFYFRRRAPDDLRPLIAQRQLYRMLTTADLRAAIVRARTLAAQTDQLFAALRDVNDQRKFQKVLAEHWGAIRANGAELIKRLSIELPSTALPDAPPADRPDATKGQPAAAVKAGSP